MIVSWFVGCSLVCLFVHSLVRPVISYFPCLLVCFQHEIAFLMTFSMHLN